MEAMNSSETSYKIYQSTQYPISKHLNCINIIAKLQLQHLTFTVFSVNVFMQESSCSLQTKITSPNKQNKVHKILKKSISSEVKGLDLFWAYDETFLLDLHASEEPHASNVTTHYPRTVLYIQQYRMSKFWATKIWIKYILEPGQKIHQNICNCSVSSSNPELGLMNISNTALSTARVNSIIQADIIR